MDELLELLAAIAALGENATPEAVAALVAENADTEGLTALLAAAQAQAEELLAAGDPTDETLASLEALALAASAIDGRLNELAEAAETRASRAAELADAIRGEADGDGEEGDTPAEDAPAEGDEPATPAEGDEPAEADDEPAEAVAAAATPPSRPRIGAARARRPASMTPRPSTQAGVLPDNIEDWGLVASANAPNTPAGARLTTRDQLAQAFLSAFEATRGYRHGPRVKINVARAGTEDAAQLYGAERTLGLDPGVNHRRIEAAVGHQAIRAAGGFDAVTAAGGICAPSPVRYDLPIIGTDERPVRDQMLTRFGADRGGVRVIPPPVIEDLDGAIGIWTHENDEDPDDPAVKPCLTLTCPDDEESIVDAITRCLEVGNFRARYFPEQVEAWMRLAAVNHARRAESRLLGQIGASSTQVTQGQVLGTVPDALAALDRATAIITSSNRLAPGTPLRWGVPFWLINQMRTDEARRIPGGGSTDERLALAEARIQSWLAVRNVTMTPFLDGEAGQIFARQGDGPMIGWPSTVVTYLYPDGSHLFLDGGTLDLGMYRDSVLTGTNDMQVFAETFEGHIFHGVESWRLTLDTCPDGSVSGTVDIDPCSTGS